VLKIIRSKEAGETATVEENKPNNGDNLNNVGSEISGTFRNKRRKYLKDTITKLEINSKNKKLETL
jgi:hypothetical protein